MRLDELVVVQGGVNSSRANISGSVIKEYSMADFDRDRYSLAEPTRSSWSGPVVETGDILVSLVRGEVVIASNFSSGKIIGQNFAKILFPNQENDSADKRILAAYFVYLLNEDPEVLSQIRILRAGSSTVQKRLTSQNIGNIKVDLIPTEQQEKIGNLCILSRQIVSLQKRRLDLWEQKVHTTLQRCV
ncbi:hypothetical protein KIMH_11350 [Bombiscardovia apis]|uniref:Type I restriction modification DNA specificity domain-containing protein n=1 Tax=Bombiscardovia apis TaxID=2932182 RepID=A0ABN6SG94_9BIFI|nr:hypothetical protein [Bombiscardovia apis]BDR55024.1 hypothetical protein KIMH_11350 [Bombiscardovia apis]